MAKLVLLQGGEAIPHDLPVGESVLGRHPDCSIQLDSNMVSRRHARVMVENDQSYIEDLGSGNGTFVNGRKIDEPTFLKHEDRIKLGPLLLRYEMAGGKRESGGTAEMPIAATMMNIDLAAGETDMSTIMGTADAGSPFGVLDVQPEAKLKAVLEISRSLAGTVDLEAILPKILDELFRIFPHADRSCVLLKAPDGGMVPRAIKHRREGDDESVKISRTILNRVLEDKAGILSADAANDSRFEASESISALTIRSMMCVPLLSVEQEPMGAIHIDTQNAMNQFKTEDLDLLMAVAGQAALSYDSARLMVTYLEKQKQDNEMEIAANVQRALLPEDLPAAEGYHFFASYDAAQAVGGDYYDCMTLEEEPNKVCVAFGDVAGKGVPASLVMSRLSSVVQNTMQFVNNPGDAIGQINNQMCAKAVEGRFVTFVLGVIDTQTHQLDFVNAGHMPLMIRLADGTIEEIGEAEVGVPLGVLEDFPFDVVTRTIAPGELVVIYTDGVSEAMNPAGDLYGMDRLRELVSGAATSDAEELGRLLLDDVRKHANGRPQNDDITIMVFGRQG